MTLVEGTDRTAPSLLCGSEIRSIGTENGEEEEGGATAPQESGSSVAHACFHLIQWQQLAGL